MITLQKTGNHKLIETKKQTKILYLDDDVFAWVEPKEIGEILVISHKKHKTDCILSVGRYCIYDVNDEPDVSAHQHLELEVGRGVWQGYLLLTGLPDDEKKRARIIPTDQVITENPELEANTGKRAGSRGVFTAEEVAKIGSYIGVNFKEIDKEQFRRGLKVELEHGAGDAQTNVTDDNLITTGKIALAHLKEIPDYYTRLKKMETDADS